MESISDKRWIDVVQAICAAASIVAAYFGSHPAGYALGVAIFGLALFRAMKAGE
ncbi:hypothetical protein [Paraburkholderia sp. WSM4175]|uniref:hypothetical protein n=1 Tax=Paraburkholderia sp. WSM4175 TaxID=2991072 RepID=UPI003D1A1D43